jgi:hypothetical protein
MKCRWNQTMLNLCGMSGINSGHHNLPTYEISLKSNNVEFVMMSRIYSLHQKISTGHHFQNGRHNTAQIQHCSISTKFHMWVDYDVLNWFPLTTGLKNKSKATFEIEQCWIFVVLWWPFWKWRPVEIFRCRESIQDVRTRTNSQNNLCKLLFYCNISFTLNHMWKWGSRCHNLNCMVVGFINTCAITVYHNKSWEFESRSWRGVLNTKLCDKVCHWLATYQWFSPGPTVSSTNKMTSMI